MNTNTIIPFSMISKKEDAKSREFKGVSFDVLAVGQQSMVTKMNYHIIYV